MNKRNFTLVELLVVVGIIAILAGLLTPAVIGAQQQGRITQARSDMATLSMAFKGLDSTYGKMMQKTASGYCLGSKTFTAAGSGSYVDISPLEASDLPSDEYCLTIAELSDPGNEAFTNSNPVSLNKRKMKFLDPRPEYDPGASCTAAANKKNTWLDPWGKPYHIRVNVDYTEQIVDPSDTSKKIAAKVILWSNGPDAEDSGTPGDDNNKDNVCSWKDSWL